MAPAHTLFDFLKIANDYWGPKFKMLILTSHSSDFVFNLAANAGINRESIIIKFVPYSEIPDYIGLANFAITPVKPVPTKLYCSPIKDGEYWALGLPVIITKNISNDSEIIESNHIGAVINEFNDREYLRCVKIIDDLISNNSKDDLYNKIRPIAVKYRNYSIAKDIYTNIYN